MSRNRCSSLENLVWEKVYLHFFN